MNENEIRQRSVDRFLKYVQFDTQSDPDSETCPSTEKQKKLSLYIVDELKSMGLEDAHMDDDGYVYATLKGNVEGKKTVGFIAHVDTSPDMSGKDIKPRLIENYDGKDILLNEEKNIYTKVSDYPEIADLKGMDIIVTDGTTLLGADDKAGVSEIVTAVEYLINHPEIERGDIKIGFTPDEEIGRGADKFDVEKFGADFAYTLDGSVMGEIEYENFNAAYAKVLIQGRNVHPGFAKNKLINALYIAGKVMELFPSDERPETTEGREGFFHLNDMKGNVDRAEMTYIIRDFDRDNFEKRKEFFKNQIEKINSEVQGEVTADIGDQYYNMREKVEPVMYVVDIAKEAMESIDVEPIITPIRGGTDGARLSFMGLPCPNLFAGGINFHGINELVPTVAIEKATKLVIEIVKRVTEVK